MTRTRTTLLFVLLGALWGTSFVAIEVGLEFFPTVLFASVRYYVAGAVMFLYAVRTATRWRPNTRDDWATIATAGAFMIAGHHALLYAGQQYVSGAVAAVVISLGPVLTAGFASLLLPTERMTLVGLAGFGLGIGGVWILAEPDPTNLFVSVRGIGLVFLSAVAFGLGAVLTRRFRTDLDAPALQAWGMLLGALVLHALGVVRGEALSDIAWTTTSIGILAYLSLVSGSLAFLIYFSLLDRIGPAQINLIGYVEPVFATLVSFVVLGRLVDSSTAAGFVAIFCGFALIKRRSLAKLVTGRDGFPH